MFDRGPHRIAIKVDASSGTSAHDSRELETVLKDLDAKNGWITSDGSEST